MGLLLNDLDKPLNLFYGEPESDRWIKFDRYPRRLIRRLLRGKKRPGGVGMIAVNLKKGLDKLNVPYRFNDYSYIKQHPEEVACIIGMPQMLFNRQWDNPVILGAGIFSHPVECPDLFSEYPNVKRVLVPGEWMRKMFEPYYNGQVLSWPVGIDTDRWSKEMKLEKEFDFLIYDKVRWKHEEFERSLINPICQTLEKHHLSYKFIRYGAYTPEELQDKISRAKAVIFLCEHETQGLAYQQILSTGTPILAWERAGYWEDPYYFPNKVKFEPVSSTPYWDERCGIKFAGVADFEGQLLEFNSKFASFKPRDYITENLSLEKCAAKYLDIYRLVLNELN